MIPEPKANSSPVVWVIAIPSPLHKVFEYLPPASGRNNPEPGARVRLPFAGREVTGIFIQKRHSQLADVTKLKQVKILLDPSDTLLSRDQLTLLQWFSDYYLVALGEAIPLGLSNRERKGNAEWQPPLDHLYRTTNTQGLIEAPNRAKQQQAALAIIGSDTIAVKDLEQKGISKTVIRSLVSSGLASKVAAPNCPSPRKTRELELTDEQRYVCQQLGANLDAKWQSRGGSACVGTAARRTSFRAREQGSFDLCGSCGQGGKLCICDFGINSTVSGEGSKTTI